MIEITVFKIRDKETELFSTGGMTPKWTRKGKTWNQINHIKAHLKQFIHRRQWLKEWSNNIPEEWEVVEINSSIGIKTYSARELFPIENIYV